MHDALAPPRKMTAVPASSKRANAKLKKGSIVEWIFDQGDGRQ